MSKQLDLPEFLEGMKTPTKKLTITQLRQREELWRALWSWLDDEVKYYVVRVGQTVRMIKRDYKGIIGELGSVKFSLAEMELVVSEKTFNYNDGKFYYEDKVVKIPSGSIMIQEFISDSQLAEEIELPEVRGLDEDVQSELDSITLASPAS